MTTIKFTNASTDFYFASGISRVKEFTDIKKTIFITDENVYAAHTKRFRNFSTIVIKAGEKYKIQRTVDSIIQQLIEMGADRQSILIGVGGGVVTDITGYVASVYMRGIKFGFIPTTILGLVDASIGGKNGIDTGLYKNMVGTIVQPSFILHDLVFLNSLPEDEWANGFAEIIKHACIKDADMFEELEQNSLKKYRSKKKLLYELLQRNALLKCHVVQKDEFEKGDRKLLNFGHTFGHAIENTLHLKHGYAISIGMMVAARISEQLCGFKDSEKLMKVLDRYELPTQAKYNRTKALALMTHDKKKTGNHVNYILLEKIGKAVIKQISFEDLAQII